MKKRIVIIGGASGIGLQLAKRLSSDGACVVIASRDPDKLVCAKKEIGNDVETFTLDASSENEVIAFFRQIGDIDHLVVTLRGPSVNSSFKGSSTEEVKKAFDGKFWAHYFIVRHCLENIKKDGSIILTSGIASQRSYPDNYWQAFTNSAIESLVKSLAPDILPIRINAISPGFTERKKDDFERYDMVKSLEPKLPIDRLASQDEIVEGYLFLMKSSYSTGTILFIDGGILTI